MTILVTGATGFLGSHVAEQLSGAGRKVRALVRESSNTEFLSTLENVDLVFGAVDDAPSCVAAAEGVTGVIHCAGLVKARNGEEFRKVNTEGTENLMTASMKAGTVKRFVFVSSQATAGPSDVMGSPVHVGQESEPVTAYGRSKLAAEKTLLAYKKELPVTILRPPAIYGPRDREILVFFKAVKGGILPLTNPLDAKYSMIYGPDCAAATIRALDADIPSGSVLFVEDGRPVSFREMIEQIEIALDKKAWLRLPLPKILVQGAAALTEVYGKVTNQAVMLTMDKCKELHAPGWVCNGDDAKELLDWEPKVQFAEGVKITANWYRQEGWL